MESESCLYGSCGKAEPTCFLYAFLYLLHTSSSPSALNSVSSSTPNFFFTRSNSCSKSSCSIPITTSPNILISLRYASHAKRALPVNLIKPWTAASVRPRFRTVSIMPGIDTAAPERTETRSGFDEEPKILPVSRSTLQIAFAVASPKPLGIRAPWS